MARMDLNEDDEKVNIENIFWRAMDILSDDDKKLPRVICISHFIVLNHFKIIMWKSQLSFCYLK